MMNDASEVKIRIRDKYVVQITPAFKCNGVWPRSAAQWPSMTMTWPHPNMAAQGKMEGFDLLSKESVALQNKQSSTSMEGDAWIISLHEAENLLLVGGPRKEDWEEAHIGDRTCGILMQLISCLQCRRCPHYFLPAVDLFRGKSPSSLDNAAKLAWRLLRELLTNGKALENL